MNPTPWEQYVRRLATDAWSLDPHATESLVRDIRALITAGDVTDAAVAEVLYDAGVLETSADLIAPSIRVAIVA
jgi:hypothetical protein